MASAAQDISPTVTVASDKMSAQLVIRPGCDPATLNAPMLKEIIRGRGVEVTDFTSQAIQGFLENRSTDDQTVTLDIACAQPPIHGTDGSVEWLVDADNNSADQKDSAKAPPDPDHPGNAPDPVMQAVSHYDKCAFVMVDSGDVVARIHEAVLGQDGRDVTGNTIPAKSGKDFQLQFDESIMRKADGTLIAQQDGVLYREPGKALIRKRIEIKDYVDFSTGNLDFDGDIYIGKGVRDCFKIKATGNIEVKGLIEAATIEAGKDLAALGGFAGRERGFVNIGRDLKGKYLDNVQGHINNNLCIDREVINCDLMINGGIQSPHGALIGGTITPTRETHIGTLGSGAGVETVLIIGAVPRLDPFAEKLDAIVQSLTRDVEKLTEEQDIINKMSTKGKMTATDKERQTEIMFELSNANTNLQKAQRTLDNVTQKINKRRSTSVIVERIVNQGVVIVYNQLSHKITRELKGPAKIYLENKQLVYRQGDAPSQPLSQIADVKATRTPRVAA